MKLLIIYDYFYPGYKAGGPIQSLTNLALALQKDFTISVITSAYDLQSTITYPSVIINAWNKVRLPGSDEEIKVYYSDNKTLTQAKLQYLLSDVNPGIVYLNGIYSPLYFRLPLSCLRKLKSPTKIVICPRGMLQSGALAVKPLKKKLYLKYLNVSGLLKNCWWHATNMEESEDIKKNFPTSRGITVAPNIPKPPIHQPSSPLKEKGKLKLIYLSLITEKKNLLLLLQVIKLSALAVTLDIYGPIKDKDYWKSCQELIEQMPVRLRYKGDVVPIKVQEVISNYDGLILLTKGENFGHALYEGLSVGRPIITSYFTPWSELERKEAGWNVDINDPSAIAELLNRLVENDETSWKNYCFGAYRVARDYYKSLDTNKEYQTLFSIQQA